MAKSFFWSRFRGIALHSQMLRSEFGAWIRTVSGGSEDIEADPKATGDKGSR